MDPVMGTEVGNNTSIFGTFSELSTKPEADLKNVWNKIEEKMLAKNIWLIAPDPIKSYKEVFRSAKTTFRGIFRFLDDSKFKSPPFVDFILINQSIPVHNIKSAILKFAHLSEKENNVRISFKGLVPLKDDVTLSGDLHCHGRGGEQFLVSISNKPA